ncbi:MAG TPA: serine hydrolase [Thermoanaerobaculia bacterium]|nr:serine hydrolase [Thermoanaerobaculia bacterium]
MTTRVIGAIVLVAALALPARADFREFQQFPLDAPLEKKLSAIADATFAAFPKLQPGHLSITVVELDGKTPKRASFAGGVTYHPASVVKMPYLGAIYEEASRGRVTIDPPLEAAMKDMIVESLNDATSYVVDRLTGTTSGPELAGYEWERFVERRNIANRWLAGMGYDLNANGKTWCEGVYGREKQLLGANREFRNRVTSDAVASFLTWIARRRAVSPEASDAMLALMSRPLDDPKYSQVVEFGGEALPPGSKLWSKAGWTGEVRHDAMFVELPGGRRYVAAILTRGAAEDVKLLPFVSGKIVEAVGK